MEGRLKQTIRHPKMEVLVDFNGLGLDKINEWQNITDYVLDISGSKEKATETVGGVTSDIVTFATDNKGNVFSNTNPNSPFYQKVKSNVDFVLKTGFKGEELKIYAAGVITKFAPSWNDKKYNVSAEDYFYLLKNEDAPKTAYQDISLDELVHVLLDTAGIPSQIKRIIPKTEFNFQYFKFEEGNCFDALKKLMEISVGQAYFEGLNFVFETKLALDYELDLTVKHTIEEDDIFTFDETVEDSDIVNAVSIVSDPKTIFPKELVFQTPENIVQVTEEPVTFGDGSSFYIDTTHLPIINNEENPISVKNLTQGRTINILTVDKNTGKITIAPESLSYVAKGDLLIVSYSYQQLVLLPGQSRTYSLNLTGEVHVLTDVDVAVWDATGQLPREYSTTPNKANTVSLNQFTFNQTSGLVTVVLKNNYTEGITISTLQLRGNPIKSANPLEVYVRDLPSINEYKKHELQITNNYFTNTKLAQKIAQYIVDNRSVPRKKIGVDMDGYTELELNDIAKVIESESGTNHTFYADRIDYSFSADAGWSAKVTFTQTETEQWVYESFKGESWEKTNPGNPIDDFVVDINANMIKNGGAELHTGIADFADAGAVGGVHYVPDYWKFTRSTGNAAARLRTGGELALHADQSFEISTSNSGSGYYEQTLTGIVPNKTHSASFVARLDGSTGVFIVEQYANTTLLKTLQFNLPEGLKEYEFQFASEPTATSFVIKFKKNAGTKGVESMIFDKVKVEESDKASLYLEANETQSVQAGQKYDNSVIIGNNQGVSVYDANNNQRVRMGQYAPGKYGMSIDNGSLEIRNGLLYEQLATDVGKKLNISENNAITSLATSMSGLDGELGTLSGTVNSHASLIQQNSEAISQRVLTSTYTADKNGILTRLSDAETVIDQTAEDITLLATKDQLSELGDTVESNTAAINVNATAITQRVTTTTYNQGITDVKGYADSVATSKANAAELNAKNASEKTISIGTTAPTDTTRKWLDTSKTPPVLMYYSNGWKKASATTASEVGAETPTGAQTKANAAENNAKGYTDGQVQPVISRLATAESSITQQADLIQQRVTKTEFDKQIIGVRNSIPNGVNFKSLDGWAKNGGNLIELSTKDGKSVIHAKGSIAGNFYVKEIKRNTEYVYSIEIFPTIDIPVDNLTPAHYWLSVDGATGQGARESAVLLSDNKIYANKWNRIDILFKTKDIDGSIWFRPFVFKSEYLTSDAEYWVSSFSLTEGNKAVTPMPSPSDVDNAINTVSTRLSEAESTITQQADMIQQRVTSSTFTQEIVNTKSYADTKATSAETNAKGYADTKKSEAISSSNSYADGKATTAETNAKSYADGKAATAESNAKGYADGKIAPVLTRLTTAESSITQHADQIQQRVTKTEFESLSIGGRNYYKKKSFVRNYTGVTVTYDENENTWTMVVPTGNTGSWRGLRYAEQNAIIQPGRTYTISFEAYSDKVVSLYVDVNNFPVGTNSGSNDNDDTAKRVFNCPNTIPGKWVKASVTFTMPSDKTQNYYDASVPCIMNGFTPTEDTTIKFRNLQFEEGNRATDWKPAVEDTNAAIDGLGERMSTAESTITQQADMIQQRVTSTTYTSGIADAKTYAEGKASTAESNAKGYADTKKNEAISAASTDAANKANTAESNAKGYADGKINPLATRVSTAESTITQQADLIQQRVTKTEFDSLSIGGRNLLLGTAIEKTVTGTGGTNECTNVYDLISRSYSLVAGKEVTISFDIVFSVNTGTAVLQWNSTPWGSLADKVNASTTKKHYSFTNASPTDGLAKGIQVRLDGVNGTATISNVKLEFGNRATAWCPAFEDIQIGGRNKILNSSFKNGMANWSSFGSTVSVIDEALSPTGKAVKIVGTTTNGGIWYSNAKLAPSGMEVGKQYTISIIAKGSGRLEFGIERLGSTSIVDLTSGYKKYTVTQYAASLQNIVFYQSNATVYIHSIKMEESDRSTEWTPAPEDTDTAISGLDTRISTAESNITQQADMIQQRVTSSTYTQGISDTKSYADGKASTAESNAKGYADTKKTEAISSANAYTNGQISPLATRLSTAESTITQQADQISQRVTKTDFDNSFSGVRNLIPNSDFFNGKTGWSFNSKAQLVTNFLRGKTIVQSSADASTTLVDVTRTIDNIEPNTEYTFSANLGGAVSIYFVEKKADGSNTTVYRDNVKSWLANPFDEMPRVSYTFTTQPDTAKMIFYFRVNKKSTETTTSGRGTMFKLEKGNKATDWLSALEDSSVPVDALEERVSTAESNITQQATQIQARVTQTNFDNQINNTLVDRGSIDGTDWNNLIKMGVYRVYKLTTMPNNFPSGAYEYGTLTVQTSGNSVTQTYSTHGSARQVYTRTKWNSNDWNAWKQVEDVEGSQAKVNSLKTGEIDPLKTRVASAESTITQQADLISQKVSSTDYNGTTLVSMINQTASTVKIQAKNIQFQGAVTVLSDITGNLGTMTAGTLVGTVIKTSRFEALSGDKITLGSYGWIDTAIAGVIKRSRFGTEGGTYLAVDDNQYYHFVMGDRFSVSLYASSDSHFNLRLGSATVKGLSTSPTVQIRNQGDNDYADLVAKNLTLLGSIQTNGDAEIISSGSVLRLVGAQHGFMEFFPFGKAQGRKGWIGYGTAGDTMMTVKANSALRLDSGAARIDLDNASAAVYIKSSSGGDATIYAKSFTPTSKRELKKNIELFEESENGQTPLEEIMNTNIYKYHFKDELDSEIKHTGVVLDESPVGIVDIRGKGIDVYSMVSYSWSGIQELKRENDSLKEELKFLKRDIEKILGLLKGV